MLKETRISFYGSKKLDANNKSLIVTCASNHWDGNFLNWLAMRKKDVTMQAIIGGKTLNAQSNEDGSADTMVGESKTGEDGAAGNDCSGTNKPCWAYVKWVPVSNIYDTSTPPNLIQGGFTGRMPTNGSLAADTAGAAVATPSAGRFFGLEGGNLWLNVDNTIDPFDGSGPSSPLKLQLSVDLNTEPDTIPQAHWRPTPTSISKSVMTPLFSCMPERLPVTSGTGPSAYFRKCGKICFVSQSSLLTTSAAKVAIFNSGSMMTSVRARSRRFVIKPSSPMHR